MIVFRSMWGNKNVFSNEAKRSKGVAVDVTSRWDKVTEIFERLKALPKEEIDNKENRRLQNDLLNHLLLLKFSSHIDPDNKELVKEIVAFFGPKWRRKHDHDLDQIDLKFTLDQEERAILFDFEQEKERKPNISQGAKDAKITRANQALKEEKAPSTTTPARVQFHSIEHQRLIDTEARQSYSSKPRDLRQQDHQNLKTEIVTATIEEFSEETSSDSVLSKPLKSILKHKATAPIAASSDDFGI